MKLKESGTLQPNGPHIPINKFQIDATLSQPPQVNKSWEIFAINFLDAI